MRPRAELPNDAPSGLARAGESANRAVMKIFAKIFGWWDGATFGTWFNTRLTGEYVGSDSEGNRYYKSRKPNSLGYIRRWVMYKGENDASRVPADWHNWLHGTLPEPPDKTLPPPRGWEAPYTPNETGTPEAYLPSGALGMGGQRAAATGDYDSWSPDN